MVDIKDNLMEMFVFLESDPYTENFEFFGIESKNFLLESGFYSFLFFLVFCFHLTRFLVNLICLLFSGQPWARSIGYMNSERSYVWNFISASLRLMIETYFELSIMLII